MNTRLPVFNRQKFILMFIKAADGNLSKLDFQKLLFLYHRQCSSLFYDFIPYHYGCYSFQANADLETLQNLGWLKVGEKEITLLKYPEKGIEVNFQQAIELKKFMSANVSLRGDELIKFVYKNHPYYAIKSRIVSSSGLNNSEIAEIKRAKSECIESDTVLFTIGYEGSSLESYINKLIQKDVRLLCDVRNNPLSRKYGFSKAPLSIILLKIGIEYIHIPELGIHSEERKNLNDVNDYKNLFEDYANSLQNKKMSIEKVFDLINRHKRVALTCFEKEPKHCHRYYLSRFIETEYGIKTADL
ncbi:MAG TPA: hypothetical protein DD381_01535 [Lentisphaeria bacterium]|nr:MAG: hypothetical protein A2X47_10495 [Lentisphaerae bacterium GWF2_38_69]HBM15025.1 hypothetical protein [Lentisphaeria bacterium]